MTDHIMPQQFEEAGGTEDWRVLGEGACTFFPTGSFAAGAGFVQAIGRLAGIDGEPPKRATIQVFDSFDQAKDYRNGPAWKAILDLQKKATKTRSYVVEGL